MSLRRASDRPQLAIEIQSPGVVVLVGAAGAGKTSLARRLFAANEILSSDALRGAVSGDETDQSATRLAFTILHRHLERRLAIGRLVVVDATNLRRTARAAVLRRAAATRSPAVAIVLALPAPLVHARNAGRAGRVVPSEIVERHLGAVARLGSSRQAIVARLTDEGFGSVHVLETAADLERVVVIRISRTAS